MSSALTVAQLRAALRERKLDATGLKAELVARLDDAIAAEGKPVKKRAVEKDDGDPPAPKRSRLDDLKKMTVFDLREALSARQLPTAGRKNELVERLGVALESGDDQDDDKGKSNADSPSGKNVRASSRLREARKEKAEVNASKVDQVLDDKEEGSTKAKAQAGASARKGKEVKKEKEEAKIAKAFKKGRAVLDEVLPEHIKSSCHVLEEGSDVYDAMLNQTNVANNNNKYYKLQCLESDDMSKHYVWFRWGRVGHHGQNQLHSLPRDYALKEFQSKFYEKTRNRWNDRHQFVPKPGKYTLLEMDYEEQEEAPKKEKKKEPLKKQLQSKLDARVQQFVSLICDLKMMRQQMVEIGYDARKMPLGKLSKSTILKGYEVLKSIAAVLESKGRSREDLQQLSSKFYTVIPHDFGRHDIRGQSIDTQQKLKDKIAMVEALGEITIASQVLEDGDEDDPAFAHYQRLKCKLDPLDKNDDEFCMVHEYLKNTHGKTHANYNLNIREVFKVQRDGEDDKFSCFAQTPNRMLLWHGSRLTNWTGILSQGLRIAPPEAPSTGYMFGKGVYFADMVSKSANYCFTSRQNPHGVLLLCEVALGEMNELCHADYNASRLPSGKLSTRGLGRTVPDSSKSRTLADGVVVPLGKPASKTGLSTSLEYNEYIVYDTNQIRMRYVLQVDFEYKLGYY